MYMKYGSRRSIPAPHMHTHTHADNKKKREREKIPSHTSDRSVEQRASVVTRILCSGETEDRLPPLTSTSFRAPRAYSLCPTILSLSLVFIVCLSDFERHQTQALSTERKEDSEVIYSRTTIYSSYLCHPELQTATSNQIT